MWILVTIRTKKSLNLVLNIHVWSYRLIRPTFSKNLKGEMLWVLFQLEFYTMSFSLKCEWELYCFDKAFVKPSCEV